MFNVTDWPPLNGSLECGQMLMRQDQADTASVSEWYYCDSLEDNLTIKWFICQTRRDGSSPAEVCLSVMVEYFDQKEVQEMKEKK